MELVTAIQDLHKALEAGNYNAAPSALTQGASLQIEDLTPVMKVTTFGDEHIKVQKTLKVSSCKSLLAQFDRQLSYGQFGGSAQFEGNVGQEETSDYVRIVVPMCFYSSTRRVTIQSTMVGTVDGIKSDEREAASAAKKIAGDIEFDLLRGGSDFSNAGTFDGNPLAGWAQSPAIQGIDLQVRQSDTQRSARDLMFSEYGSDESVVVSGGGNLSQSVIEDASVRSAIAFGSASKLLVDPKVQANYNKISFGKERIILAGSPQNETGADLRKQWVSGGTVTVESTNFLRGKYKPGRARQNGPAQPVSSTPASVTDANAVTAFKINDVYNYFATACSEVGESVKCPTLPVTIAATGDKVTVTIIHPASGTYRFYNVYRGVANAAAGSEKFIGRVVDGGGANTVFTDLGNKIPGFVTGLLIEDDTMEIKELSPYSRLKLAVTELSMPEAHFRFCTLAMYEPRKNVIIDNLV